MDPALKELMEGSGEDEIEAIVRLDPEGGLPPYVRVVSRFGEIATVRLPRERIAETWADESVVSLKAARPFGLDPDPLPFDASLETAESFEDRDDTRRPEGLDATGRGVIVAVLDWGFDFAHPNFRRRDGSTRALALWDQSAPGAGPQPYGYGRVSTREEIDRALRHDEPYRALGYHPATGDPTGYGAHGTHVLDIAAGNGRAEGSPSGIAPEADLLFVHLATRGTEGRANLGDSVTLLEALDWVARQAGDRPWVVNLSVGRHGGPHTGLTLVEQGIDALLAAGPGRAVVQSTGNYFAANVHASGYLRPGQERTLRWCTDKADVTPNELEVWYPGADAFEVEVRSPGGEAEVRVPLGGQASIVVEDREAGRVYHRAKDPGNGDNHIDVFLYPQAPAGCWEVTLIGEDVVDGRFHAWVERDPGCPTCQSRLDPGDADPTTTIGTIANGFRSIAVGAYDAHSDDRRLGAFSSSGPTRDGRLKPDLLAPGVGVLAARSASLELGSDTPLLTRNSGTSMAAPHVTGTVALMFEVAPRPLTIQETRKLLLSTSREAHFDAEPAARLGSGYLDIERAVEAARSFAVPAAAKPEAVEDFQEILEKAAQEPEPTWIGPEAEQEEIDGFDDGGEPELEEAMDDERDIHPCGCAAREAETETFESEAEPPCECGCRGAREEEEEDETTRWEPEWGSAEPEGEEAESGSWELPAEYIEAAEPTPPAAGWWEGALSPAALFDGLLAGGAARRHLEATFEVLALPGDVPLESPREGDLVVRRALGEGSLAHMAEVAGEDDVALDPVGRMPFDQLLARPRTAGPAWPEAEAFESAPEPSPVQARILWPALGFPAVVTPSQRPSSFTMRDGDATRCICVLVLSNRRELSKEEAARHLRCVPWAERGRRHIAAGSPGSFAEVELTVRNDVREPRLTVPGRKDKTGEHVAFGGNGSGQNGVTAYLPIYVRDFYRNAGLAHLHEIRVSEEATARLQDGQYHLFWNNQAPDPAAPSDEMRLLLNRFALPRRKALGKTWQEHGNFLLKEYEYEYGGIHLPYRSQGAKETRAEILHPLFVQRRPAESLRIGHVTDTHVDVRADVYEHNLKAARIRGFYNNFNTSFVTVYEDAKRDSDVLLLTGDLIDYGRGHWGLGQAGRLQEDSSYHVDRNWFLFYYLLAAGDAYTRPAYTILGNHDWRLNPYPPFAPGAPNPNELLHDHLQLKPEEQRQVIATAHGPGYKRAFSYAVKAESTWQLVKERTGDALATLVKLFGQTSNVEKVGFPTETSIESVAWYLLSINPFLDYAFTLPGKQSVLMLDWAKDEAVLFPRVVNGKEGPYDPLAPGSAAGTPRPSSSLTALQKRLVADFAGGPSKAKVVGIHAPLISPYSDWYDRDLLQGRKSYSDPRKARGPNNGHPLFAIRPGGAPHGMVPERGSILRDRDWFIKTLADPGSSVRMVLSGHVHRNGLYVVHPARQEIYLATPKDMIRERRLAGALLVRGVVEQAMRSARPPAVTVTAEGKQGPLYVTTTSAGPRGSFEERPLTEAERARGGVTTDPGYAHLELASDGTIRSVDFRESSIDGLIHRTLRVAP